MCLPAAVRAEEFDSNGVKVHYFVEGKGEPVILIHGFAIDAWKQWVLPGVVRELAKDYQVIAPDIRGHGKSGKPHEPKQYGQEMVEDVVRLLDRLKIERAHVVGYSMGGMIALKLVTTHPDRVSSVTLGGMGLLQPGTEPMFGELADSLEKGKGFAPLMIWLTPPGQLKPTAEQVEGLSKFLMATNDPKALAAAVRSFEDKTLAIPDAKLKAITAPMLALVGDLDPLQKSVVDLEKQVPAMRVIKIKSGDHVTAVIDPLFRNSLREFLSQHGQKAKAKKEP
jgi:pimeloyl-ACP methyl ester carboxylesterase